VSIDTSFLVGHPAGPFSLFFALTDGSGLSDGTNTITISNINFFNGSPLGNPTAFGGVTGDLASTVVVTDTGTLNFFSETFSAGQSLSFEITLTSNPDEGPIPDGFAFYVLDSSGLAIPTLSPRADYLISLGIGVSGATPAIYGGDPSRSPATGNPIALPAPTVTLLDTIPPVTAAVLSPQPNAAGWNNTNVTISLNSTDSEPDGTGVKQIQWSLAGAQTGSSTVPGSTTTVTISIEGTTTLTFFGTDNAGIQEAPKALSIQIDKTPPAFLTFPVSLTVPPTSSAGAVVTYALPTATDATSGVSSAGVSCAPASGSTFPLGTTTVTCTVADNAGNVATGTFKLTVHYNFKWTIGKPAPALNSAQVSDAYKVAFSLGGNFGLNAVTGVTSTRIACSGPRGVGLPEAEGRLGLSYNSTTGNYQQTFGKPGASAAGTCAQVNFALSDGTAQAIDIKFVH